MALLCCIGVAKADFRQEYTVGADFWTEKQMASSAYPANVATQLTAHATDDKTHEVWGANASIIVPAEGNVEVTFSYKGWDGSNLGMTILGVDVVDGEGNVVKGDYHVGFAGGTPNNNVYTLADVPTGDYTIRYFVCNRTDGDHKLDRTAGKVLVKGANLPVVTSLDETKVYRLKSGHADFYLEIVDFAQSSGEGALQFKKKANNSGQLFALEKTTDDQYHLKSVKDGTIYYVNANTWNFFAKTTAPEEGFSVYNIGNNRYAFLQTYATHNGGNQHGYLGNTNGASEKGKIFNNQPYNAEDGISWIFEEVNVADLKATAKAELDNLAKLTAVYPDATSAKGEIDNVTAGSSLAELETAVKQMDQIIVNYKKLADGKDLKFTNHGSDGRNGKYLGYDKPNTRAAAVASSGDDVIWTLKVQENGSFKLYNFVHNVYLGVPADPTPVIAAEADAPAFDFVVTDNDKAALVTGGKMVHVANHTNYKLIQYYSISDGASLWTIAQAGNIVVTREQYDAAAAAKEALPYAIQQAYGLVTDVAKYTSNAPETTPNENSSYANLLDNNYQSYFHTSWSAVIGADHYLQAEVSREVKDFVFYFKKRHNTNNNRPTTIEIQGSSDGQDFTTITTINEGLPIDEKQVDYFSGTISATVNIKYIRFVVKATNSGDLDNKYSQENPKPEGHPFFHFSEFYIFPVMPDITNLIEAYNRFSTLSITNSEITNAATALINAERSLELANIKKEVAAILDANESNHSDTPAIGQYTTTAYNELDAAYKDGEATQESLEAAIAKFEKAKNRPVFMISNGNVKDYAKDKSIYDDNDGTLNFKTTDLYDKTMWWALDLEETTVSVTGDDYVGIYNVGTGNGFLGAASIKVTETNENDGAGIADDDLFLIYRNGATHPAHFQQTNSAIVEYWSYEATSGSAAMFTYIGNTYDLNKLTDEKIAALQALKTAVDEKSYLSYLETGTGVGQYNMTSEEWSAYVAPIYEAGALVDADLTLQAEVEVSVIDARTAAVRAMALPPAEKLNLPVVGKYYRIKGANAGAENYVTGNVIAAGDRIALQAEANGATVFQYLTKDNGDGILLAVENNLYLALNSWTFKLKKADAAKTEIAASTRKGGAYTIKSGGSFFHYDNGFLNRCGSDDGNANHTAHDWHLEEVAESEVPANNNLLTNINNLSAEASYRIYGDRGFIYVADDGNMKGTNVTNVAYNPNNNKHHFAIVTIGENKYLYNVGAKKFVMKSGNGVTLTDWPEQAITIEGKTNADSNVGYDWVIKLGDNRLNLSTGDGHTYGVFTNHNTEDPGNVWAIYKVGSFAPAEASSIKKVTVNYNVEGQTFTKNYGVAAGNAISFDYDFATVTSCKVGEEAQEITNGACSVTIQDNVTISVEIDQDLPFEAVINDSKILSSTWYYLQMHSNQKKYIQYLPEQTYIEWEDATFEDGEIASHSWAFVGNVVEGFKMINFAATTTKALKATNNNPSMADLADGTAFVLSYSDQNVDGGFCMKRPDSDNYLNAQNGKVAYWNDDDAGSTFIVTPSSVVPTRGKFYRIKNNSETGYLSSGASGRTQFVADIATDASSIFYYDGDGKLLSYKNGMYLNVSNNKLEYSEAIGTGVAVEFQPSRTIGKLQILFNSDRYLFSETAGNTDSGDINAKYIDPAGGNPAGRNANYLFTVEEVTTLPVTVTEAQVTFNEEQKYVSTLFAPVALEVPAGITAYIGVNEDNYLAMEPIAGVGEAAAIIPANTGVILMADEAKTYEFSISAAAGTAIEADANIITGTVAKTVITPDANTTCYVLANDDQDGVGLYKALKNKNESGTAGNTSFFNNACKAYIPVSVAEPQAAQALAFRFRGKGQGTTEIEMPMANGQQPAAIYDLTGRRLTEIVEKGIYIVNGKKVVIK